jgi:carotenoid cleavage dioxygenase-like enzyme
MSTQEKFDGVENYFLNGNYAPVSEEHVATDMQVIGTVPNDIEGYFMRIGPNPVYCADPEAYHIFDGDGMVHQVEFTNGKATYRNRFVDTEGLRKEREKGDWIWKGMNATMVDMVSGTPPPEGGAMKDLVNTAMVYHANKFYGLMEGGTPHEMSLPELDTVGPNNYEGRLKHPFTAHPKVDVKTGEMMTFGYSPMPPFCSYSVVNGEGELVHTTPISIPKGVMMHDCAITDEHTIFLDLPITFDFERAMNGQNMLAWEPENGSRIGVIPRLGSDADVKWFDIDTCMVFHVANAWEEGDEIVLIACRSNRTDVANATENAGADDMDMTDQLARMHEWRLNMATGEVKSRAIDAVNYGEFPRINDNLSGLKTRYTYVAGIDQHQKGTPFTSEMKYDGETGALQVHPFGEGLKGGEAIFAPRVNATSEDDGYVIVFVHDDINQTSECRVIDAQNFAAEPVARVMIPHRVPFGFHATWVAKD